MPCGYATPALRKAGTRAQASGSGASSGAGAGTAAATRASCRTPAVRPTCHARAPWSRRNAATVSVPSSARACVGRRPGQPAYGVGREQVLDREPVLLGDGADRRPGGREPRSGGRVAVAPRPRRRRALVRGLQVGQLGVRQVERLLDGRQPGGGLAAHRPAAPDRQRDQVGLGAGAGQGGGDERGVRQHPAGRDVPPPGDLVAALPERAHHGELATLAHPVQPGGPPPRLEPRGGRRRGHDRGELLLGPVALALLVELVGQRVPQLDEHLDVQRGVAQPRLGEGTGRPVGGGVALLQRQPQHLLDDRAEPDPGVAQQPAGQLGVEDPGRAQAELGQAGQVLRRRVQHPLVLGDGPAEGAEVGQLTRVDEHRAHVGPAQLDEVGALAVAVAGGALGVDRDRPGPGGEGLDDRGQLAGSVSGRGTPSRGSVSGTGPSPADASAASSLSGASLLTLVTPEVSPGSAAGAVSGSRKVGSTSGEPDGWGAVTRSRYVVRARTRRTRAG